MTAPHSINDKIHFISGQQVILLNDLAELYGMKSSVLEDILCRNSDLFISDIGFWFDKKELSQLNSAVSENDEFNTGFALTKLGVSVISGFLKGKQVVDITVAVLRAFSFTEQLGKQEQLVRDFAQKFDKPVAAVVHAMEATLKTIGRHKRSRTKNLSRLKQTNHRELTQKILLRRLR